MLISDRSIRWVENLAEQERSITAGERSSLDLCLTMDEVLAEETNTFLRALTYHFDYLVKLFNLKISNADMHVRVNKFENGASLSRQGVTLSVRSLSAGSVQIECSKLDGEGRPTPISSGIIEGQFAHLHDIEWHFLGSSVTSEKVACHYLTEFLQVSRKQNSAYTNSH